MYILTDGKYYVGENPMKGGEFLKVTSPLQAKHFTYKQAKSLQQNSRKKKAWIRDFQMVDIETKEVDKSAKFKKGNGGAYIGKNDIEFDESIIDLVCKETNSILGLAGWSVMQLKTYKEHLTTALSKFDSAESDIGHALQKYKEDTGGKNPQAHKMAKIGYLLDDIRDKHKKIKQCLLYIGVMENAIQFGYSIEKIKLELAKAKHVEYEGRTEYYQIALDLLK